MSTDSNSKSKRGGKGKAKRRDIAATPGLILLTSKGKLPSPASNVEKENGLLSLMDSRLIRASKLEMFGRNLPTNMLLVQPAKHWGVSLDSKSGALDIQGDIGQEILEFMIKELGLPADNLKWLGEVKNNNAAKPKGIVLF